MRVKSVTERYRAVNEGTMSKKEFVRQMRQQYPMHITQFNGFDDSVQILKNRGLLFETKTEVVEEAKVYDDRPALTYSLDALDRGIRVELATMGVEPGQQSIKGEDLKKATKKAKDNLEKNPTHYLDLMSGESNKVDKQDKMKETKRGAKDTDVMNGLKKATLKEGYTEEQIEAAVQRIKERKAGEHEDGTPKSNDEMGDDEREDFYNNLDSVDESGEPVMVDGEELPFEDAVYDLIELTGDMISREWDHEEWLDHIESHEPHLLRKDILDAAAKEYPEDINPFIEYLDGIGYELGLNETEEEYLDKKDAAIKKAMGKDVVKEAGKTALIQTMNNAISAIKGKFGDMPGIAGIIRDFLKTHLDDLANGADPLDEFENYVDANYDSLSEAEVSEEYKAAYDSLIEAIKELNTDGDEAGAAQDAMEFIGQHYSIDFEFGAGPSRMAEKKGKDHDGDGDIDGDDYMAAKDKAIKGAMGKDEMVKEAVKSIIKKVLTENTLNEAATGNLSKFSDDYADFAGMTQIINQLENLVTEVEGFYAKTGEKLQKVFDSIGNVTNEEGLKVGGFIAPAIESAFKKDIQPVVKRGFMNSVQIPTIKQITQSDIDLHNSGERSLGEEEMEEKQTMFTPVMEAVNKDLQSFGKEIAQNLEKSGHSVKLLRGKPDKEVTGAIGGNSKLAALALDQSGDTLEIYVNADKKSVLDDLIKKYSLTTNTTNTKTVGWNDKDVARLNKGDLYIAMPNEPIAKWGETYMTRIGKFNPDSKFN